MPRDEEHDEEPPKKKRAKIESPYEKWDLYFPGKDYTGQGHLYNAIPQWIQWFLSRREEITKEKFFRTCVLLLDLNELHRECPLTDSYAIVSEAVNKTPDDVLSGIGLSAHQALIRLGKDFMLGGKRVTVRICRYSIQAETYLKIPLKALKSNVAGTFVIVKGTVVRVSVVKPIVISLDFQCTKCGATMTEHFVEGKYRPPTRCDSDDCKSRTFLPLRNQCVITDWQRLRLQEIVGEDDNREAGRIPRCVDVELTEELVDSCIPGDVVTINGIVKTTEASEQGRSGGGGKHIASLFVLYIAANYISNSRTSPEEGSALPSQSPNEIDDSALHLEAIKTHPDILRLLVNSLAPSIYGHQIVKAGFLLALFGGQQKFSAEKGKVAVRGDFHVLVVGDPGMGKSHMLQAAVNLATRGVFVCGNTATAAGLTVTVVRDGISGDYALEAGALVLADQGVCGIDEFDKQSGHDHQALLEAMEQQSISIAKAGIVCSLAARTSILAAANPAFGHYNRAKTACENLKLSPALLSRFDLIFILEDTPDKERDRLLSAHVMALHSNNTAKRREQANREAADRHQTQRPLGPQQSQQGRPPLSYRLRPYSASERQEPVPAGLLRRYIHEARLMISPILSEESKHILQSFYLELRRKYQCADRTPITTRNLEALRRVAEARAKLEYRRVVTAEDAMDAVELMRESLVDLSLDEVGTVDMSRLSGMSKGGKATSAFMARVQDLAIERQEKEFGEEDLFHIARGLKLKGSESMVQFRDMVELWSQQGMFLKKPGRRWAITSL